MKHLKRFNENAGHNPTMYEFLLALNDELKPEFIIKVGHHGGMEYIEEVSEEEFNDYLLNPNWSYINIDRDGTFLDFCMDNFSIQKLKDECNGILDDDKSGWDGIVTDEVKEEYDILCTTILTFLDKQNYDELTIQKAEGFEEWKEVLSILDTRINPTGSVVEIQKIKKLMSKFNISRK